MTTSNGFTMLYHDIAEAIMLRDFSKRQRKILDLILRLSRGCGKTSATIPHQKDFTVIGIAESHISVELQWLVDSQIIFVADQKYSFNENFDQWQISRVKPFEPEKLTDLVRINLNGSYQNGKNLEEVTKMVSENLPKREVKTSQNSKFSTSKLASPKESINKYKEREYPVINKKKSKFTSGYFGHMLNTSEDEIKELISPERARRIKELEPLR